MQAPGGATDQPVSEPQENRPYFSTVDAIFVIIALIVGFMVIRLGVITWSEGVHTEETKAHGEKVATWLEGAGQNREGGKPIGISACDAPEATWLSCRDALVASGGPLADLKNVAHPNGLLFSATCDRTVLETHGAIIIEKGSPKPPDGASFMYGAIADNEPIKEPIPLRVAICGRGYSQINVREVKF